MASEKPEKREKKDKKRNDEAGVKKDKKDKKEKKEKKEKLAAALEDRLQSDAAAQNPSTKGSAADEDSDVEIVATNGDVDMTAVAIDRTVVPFAVPVADEKAHKKIYKTVAKASKRGSLKRGVKEVVKSLRKGASSNASAKASTLPPTSVVILAGDISPPDVLSHIPVMCETAGVPFIFVTTRAELGKYAKTKRPTSVVMVQEKGEGKRSKDKEGTEEEKGEYEDTFKSLVKLVQKEYNAQAFWIRGEQRELESAL